MGAWNGKVIFIYASQIILRPVRLLKIDIAANNMIVHLDPGWNDPVHCLWRLVPWKGKDLYIVNTTVILHRNELTSVFSLWRILLAMSPSQPSCAYTYFCCWCPAPWRGLILTYFKGLDAQGQGPELWHLLQVTACGSKKLLTPD